MLLSLHEINKAKLAFSIFCSTGSM